MAASDGEPEQEYDNSRDRASGQRARDLLETTPSIEGKRVVSNTPAPVTDHRHIGTATDLSPEILAPLPTDTTTPASNRSIEVNRTSSPSQGVMSPPTSEPPTQRSHELESPNGMATSDGELEQEYDNSRDLTSGQRSELGRGRGPGRSRGNRRRRWGEPPPPSRKPTEVTDDYPLDDTTNPLTEQSQREGGPNRGLQTYALGGDPVDDFTPSDEDPDEAKNGNPIQAQYPNPNFDYDLTTRQFMKVGSSVRPEAMGGSSSPTGAGGRGRGRGRGRGQVRGMNRTYRTPELSAAFQRMHMAPTNSNRELEADGTQERTPNSGRQPPHSSPQTPGSHNRTRSRKDKTGTRASKVHRTQRGDRLLGHSAKALTNPLDSRDQPTAGPVDSRGPTGQRETQGVPTWNASEPSSISTALLEAINGNQATGLLPMAKRLLEALGLTKDYTVEEWAYFASDHGFRKAQNFGVGTGPKVIRIGKFHDPDHYVLLDHDNPDRTRELEVRTEDRPFYRGTATLFGPGETKSYATVVDEGQYPWGRGGGQLQDICAALHITPDSGVANRCSYTHLMLGLITQGFQVQQLLAMIKPGDAGAEEKIAARMEHSPATTAASKADQNPGPPAAKAKPRSQGRTPISGPGNKGHGSNRVQAAGGTLPSSSSRSQNRVVPPDQAIGPRLTQIAYPSRSRPDHTTTNSDDTDNDRMGNRIGVTKGRPGQRRTYAWKHRTRKKDKDQWNRLRRKSAHYEARLAARNEQRQPGPPGDEDYYSPAQEPGTAEPAITPQSAPLQDTQTPVARGAVSTEPPRPSKPKPSSYKDALRRTSEPPPEARPPKPSRSRGKSPPPTTAYPPDNEWIDRDNFA